MKAKQMKRKAEDAEALLVTRLRQYEQMLSDPNVPEKAKEEIRDRLKKAKKHHEQYVERATGTAKLENRNGRKK